MHLRRQYKLEGQSQSHQVQLALKQDLELSGGLNRSAGQGAKFSLLMSMLAENILARPKIVGDDPSPSDTAALKSESSLYPQPPLKADDRSWSQMAMNTQLLQKNLKDAQLWLTMHPEPLSLYDDKLRLADEVVENCDYHTQLKLNASPQTTADIEVDETKLYDVLEGLASTPLLA